MIKNLIYKELSMIKAQARTFLIMLAFISIIMIPSGKVSIMTTLLLAIIGYSISLNNLYIDEKNNSFRFLLTLPLTRPQLVKGKYASCSIISGLLFIILLLVQIILDIFFDFSSQTYFSLFYMAIMTAILNSVFFPLAFKLGYMKTIQISRFVYIGVILGLGFLLSGLTKLFPDFMASFLAKTTTLPGGIVPALMILVLTVIINLYSSKLSIKFFETREI